MTINARNRIGRLAVTAAVALAVAVPSMFAAAPAYAGTAQSPKYFDRSAVLARAKTWVDKGVPYSQTGWLGNYRTDCSGFISMAWGLDQSYVTWSLPEVARPIHQNELQPGDIILNTERHVVMFVRWANTAHSAYVVYEEAGTPHKAIQRVVRYPYDTVTANSYKPYRYVGGHSLYEPGNELPTAFMQTYAGGGQVLVPGPRASATNVKLWRIAQKRTAQKQAQRRAAAADAAKKAAAAKAGAATTAAAAPAAAGAKATAVTPKPAAPVAAAAAAAAKTTAAVTGHTAAAPVATKRHPAPDTRPPAMQLLDLILGLLTR